MSKLILVANRLPLRIDPDTGKPMRSPGGLASALSGAGVEATWVGWPGLAAEDIEDAPALIKSLAEVDTVPVMLNREELEGFYDGYANGTLWPLIHSMSERVHFDEGWFDHYASANSNFARAVLDIAEDGDTVWIHDYQLFLLPQLLRNSGRDLQIGFFLHTPFPSSDIVRTLPDRKAVLQGVLGADLIGFHTYNYLRHFRSSVLRVMGIESEVDTIWVGSRGVKLGVFPIGHDHAGFSSAIHSDAFDEAYARHAEELGDNKLLLSVERLDYTKGVPQKLAAIRHFLERCPELRADVVFVIIAVPSRQGIEEYDQLTEEVQREVGAINGEFGTIGHAPVQFLHQSFPQPELAALYALAEVCLVTPLIDGMNLVAKEYIACKAEATQSRPGVLILSEFAGAAQEMSQALQVNPHDVREVSDAINSALVMTEDERRDRACMMAKRLLRSDSAAWARGFLSALNRNQQEADPDENFATLLNVTTRIVGAAQTQAQTAALFLDYDGTLRDFVDVPDEAVPDSGLCPLLQRLAAHPGIRLTIVSGRPSEFLEKHFAGLGVTLVGEHGYRWLIEGQSEWELVNEHVDNDWKDVVLPHLEQAADQTPGANIEEKRSALVWHYRRADPEFGAWQARGLLEELTDVTASLPVSVHHGKKIVEVASQLVNKGQAVKSLVQRWEPTEVLVAGDDQTDETMFALEFDEDINFDTVKIGKGSTRATRRTDIAGLRTFLENLAKRL